MKRRRTGGGLVGHTEDGEAIGALDVEDVAILRVGDVGVAVAGNFLEDLSGDCARVRRRGAELRQHHRSPCYQRVQYRHLPTHQPPPRSAQIPLSLSKQLQ